MKKITRLLIATVLIIAILLVILILNPVFTYANKTTHNNFTIFHNAKLNPDLLPLLNQAQELLKASEYYDPKHHLDICLNDGFKYPRIVKALRGQAFAWGFYNKVVMQGYANYPENFVELNGYRWNLTQLLAHEMVHCLQYEKLGFWQSNPMANIPIWKWEGYAEYISRQSIDQRDLLKNIERMISADKNKWEIQFLDGTIASRKYFSFWMLVKYCMDIKKMNYTQVLADNRSEELVRKEMIDWYERNRP